MPHDTQQPLQHQSSCQSVQQWLVVLGHSIVRVYLPSKLSTKHRGMGHVGPFRDGFGEYDDELHHLGDQHTQCGQFVLVVEELGPISVCERAITLIQSEEHTIISGRLVAATTVTFFRGSTPSNSVRSWLSTRSATPPASLPPRLTAKASISSCKEVSGILCHFQWFFTYKKYDRGSSCTSLSEEFAYSSF